MNDSRIYRNIRIARDYSAVRLVWPSNQRIGKDIRAGSQLFSRSAADVISEANLTTMTGDRHDELWHRHDLYEF